jgi:hypothetical protein
MNAKAILSIIVAPLVLSATASADLKLDLGGGRSFSIADILVKDSDVIATKLGKSNVSAIDRISSDLHSFLDGRGFEGDLNELTNRYLSDRLKTKGLDTTQLDVLRQLAVRDVLLKQAADQRRRYVPITMTTSKCISLCNKVMGEIRLRASRLGINLNDTPKRPAAINAAWPWVLPQKTGPSGVPIESYNEKELRSTYQHVAAQLADLGSGYSVLSTFDGRLKGLNDLLDKLGTKNRGLLDKLDLSRIRL